jgi:hypothetical protein
MKNAQLVPFPDLTKISQRIMETADNEKQNCETEAPLA